VDNAQQTIFFQNQRAEPSQAFTYDSVYQLIEATGREHLGQLETPSPYGPSTVSDNWLLQTEILSFTTTQAAWKPRNTSLPTIPPIPSRTKKQPQQPQQHRPLAPQN
jgi:hypothetical protein